MKPWLSKWFPIDVGPRSAVRQVAEHVFGGLLVVAMWVKTKCGWGK
jgi:hypothetical protein